MIRLTDFTAAFQRLNRLLTTVFWGFDTTKQVISFHWHEKQLTKLNILNTIRESSVEKRTISMVFASTTAMVPILPTVPSGDRGSGQPGELQRCDLRADGTAMLSDTRHRLSCYSWVVCCFTSPKVMSLLKITLGTLHRLRKV